MREGVRGSFVMGENEISVNGGYSDETRSKIATIV